MRQFQIRPKRSPDGALEVSIAFDRSVAQLAPDEQARVFERAMGIALESAKTATDPVIQRQRAAAFDEMPPETQERIRRGLRVAPVALTR